MTFFLLPWGMPFAWGADGNQTLYLDENGSLWATGDNDNGQLGDGNQTDRNQSVRITLSGVVAIAVGGEHSLCLKNDGSLWAAGDNAYGQLGDGTNTDRNSSFVRVVDANVTAVAAGMHHSLFLKSDGSLWGMGRNDYGQLGDGTIFDRNVSVQILLSDIASIAAGAHHNLLIKYDGSLWCMGRNDSGQLGNGFTANLITPQQVLSSEVMAVSAGEGHSLLLKTDGSLWAAGDNDYGQLGNGTLDRNSSFVPVVDANVTAMAAGARHSLYLDANGSLRGMGKNDAGQLGDQTTVDKNSSVSVVAAGVSAVTAGAGHSYFLKTDGSLWAMGLNADGQLGLGDDANRSSPVEVVSSGAYRLPNHPAVVGQGSFFSLILDTSGSLRGMGQNDNGELGLAGAVDRNVSEEIVSSVKAFSEGGDYSLFVKSDGSLWGMGLNACGQLGDGTTIDRNASVQILPSGVVAISASGSNRFSLLLESNGSLQGMGLNLNGELGLGDANQRLTPTHIAISVISFAAGHDHALFVKGDGSLWAMGSNAYGQLGTGDNNDVNSPVLVVEANVTSVAAGNGHSLFLKSDGSLWSMGRNDFGQLGDGNQTHRSVPAQIFASEVMTIATGDHHSLFLRNDGSLWGMGRNHFGQLGLGDSTDRLYPTRAVTSNVTAVSAGQAHTLMLKTNALWGTGLNLDGQLGLGNLTNRTSFSSVASSGIGSLSGVITQGGTRPVITSHEGNATALVSVEENSTTLTVASVTAYDLDNSSLSFSVFGGADADFFEVNASEVVEVELEPGKDVNVTTGLVSFKLYPDYEHPHDSDLDNVYEIIVRASDGNRTIDQALAISVVDANDSSWVFTHAGVAGRSGPTQAQADANYTGSSLQGAVIVKTQGVQEWAVPYKALYRIEALGAQGGATDSFSGGRGARVVGVFDLNVSTTLRILVGQQGADATTQGTGGGGGTFVTFDDNSSLLTAGGGGGAGTVQAGGDGNASTQPGQWNTLSAPGLKTGGNGNGGGGMDGNGSSSFGGRAFAFAGLGGDASGASDGGFGGGGAADSGYGGGGGGYTGGNGGNDVSGGDFGGQGGGSYNDDVNGITVTGYRDGNGSVLITLVKALNAVPSVIEPSNLSIEENATLGTIVTDFNATDEDANATLTFTLVDGNGSTHNTFFAMESNGTIRTATTLDYETNATLRIRVRVTDNHNAIHEQAFDLNVTDVDEIVPVITLEGNASVFHEAGTVYVDPGAMWVDLVDGNGSASLSGSVNEDVNGTYVLTYSWTDVAGNIAVDVNRTVTVVDTTPPDITLNGDANVTHEAGSPYVEANATWTDLVDGNGTASISGDVNVGVNGVYVLTYSWTDIAGNVADLNRTVEVVDTTSPVITLNGDANETHEAGFPWVDANATWTDNVDGNGTALFDGGVNPYVPDVYYVTYSYLDTSGNEATLVTRMITVTDTIVPVITLEGNASLFHEAGQAYLDPGAIWTDILDGNGTADVNGTVVHDVPGIYDLTYFKTDGAGNIAAQVGRTVTVGDTTKPIITLEGNATVRHRVFQPYLSAGSKATDSLDGNLTVTETGSVDMDLPGTYSFTYSVTDEAGNEALPLTRQVEVFNDAPIGIAQRVIQLRDEFTDGSLVAVLPDLNLNDLDANCSLVLGTGSADNAAFTLDSNGSLWARESLDFEAKPSYSIRFSCVYTEKGSGTPVEEVLEVLTIEEASTGIAQRIFQLEEGLDAGSLIGVLSTLDPDDPNASREYLYNLTPETGSTDNAVFTLDANGALRTSVTFDFESKASYSIQVRVADEFSATFEQTVSIEVLDGFLPGVSVGVATSVDSSSAVLAGEVEDEGHSLGVTARGFVLGFYPDPVLGGQNTTTIPVGSGLGSFNATVPQLDAFTRHYFRAFATNSEGTEYSSPEWFDTNGSDDGPTWANGTEIPDAPRWWYSDWFGNFAVTTGTNWIYHEHYGWLYVALDGKDGFWFWQKDLGWFWTRSDLYPHLFGQTDGWYFYLGSEGNRVFLFRYSDGAWVDIVRDSSR